MVASPVRRSARQLIGEWIEAPRQQNFIIGLIMLNAITLGLETVPFIYDRFGLFLYALDKTILAVFVLEIVLKIFATRLGFFRSGWNLFDFAIVGIALVPATSALSILRTLRIFRVLRLLNKMPRLRLMVEAMLQALPSIGWLALLLGIIFYIFAVLGSTLFGAAFPEWFGGLGPTAYTLFQVMTLESWSMGIARPVNEVFPYAPLFFIPFILIATYTMLNLFIAVVVSTMQSLGLEGVHVETVTHSDDPPTNEAILSELRALREEIGRLERRLNHVEPVRQFEENL
jgi:voltage-gated sodium channel